MKKYFVILLISIINFIIVSNNFAEDKGNTKLTSFNKSKKILLDQVYYDHRITFYCGCEFSEEKEITKTNGYIPKNDSNRSKRIEWDHIVPAESFGQSFKEWRDGDPDCVDSHGKTFKGRNCARKKAIEFRYMESDMYNLVPAVGEINGLRSNYSFAMIPGERKEFGDCKVKIEDRKIEPPPEKFGDIARIYQYMEWAYPGHGVLSGKNQKLFEAWSKQDPVDAWECTRCKRIEQLQGNENPFVKKPCIERGLWGQ